MSKTVKIPTDRNPWTCNINGVPYSYTAGSTQSVPDEVAALIQQTYGFPPAPPKTEKPWPCDPVDLSAYEKIADAFTPTITSPANGDVIKYDSSSSKWVNGAASGGGGAMFEVLVDDTETEGITAMYIFGRIKAQPEEIYNAAFSGPVKLYINYEGMYYIGDLVCTAHGDWGYGFTVLFSQVWDGYTNSWMEFQGQTEEATGYPTNYGIT